METNRRGFVLGLGAFAGLAALPSGLRAAAAPVAGADRFQISLAEWSLHRMLGSGKLDNMRFPQFAKETFGIDAVEYVNGFFKDKATDQAYLNELKKRTDDLGVRNVLIMCDGEGFLGDANDAARKKAVENHYRWVEAARFLGCHSIRVNARSKGTREEQHKLAVDGLTRLSEFAAGAGIHVIVENHGGLSSDGKWMSGVLREVGRLNCGALPDFGNFYDYDRYQGVADLMPFARGVSAKSHEFNEKGDETKTDYRRMLKIVKDAGYVGYVGIEYEGGKHSEVDGIKLTKALLETVFAEL